MDGEGDSPERVPWDRAVPGGSSVAAVSPAMLGDG